jgi:oligosaccharide repeat unit polymerase
MYELNSNKHQGNKYLMFILFGILIALVSIYIPRFFQSSILIAIGCLLPILFFIYKSVLDNNGFITITNPIFLYGSFYFIFFGLGGALYEGESSNQELAQVGSLIGLIGYLLGYFFSKIFERKYNSKNLLSTYDLQRSIKFERAIFLLGSIGYVLYIFKIGSVPILMNDLEQARVDASIKGGAYFRVLAYLLIISSTIAGMHIIFSKINNMKIIKQNIYIFILGIIMLFSLGNRSPIYNILFTVFVIFLIFKFKGKISISKLLIIFVAGLIFVVSFVGGIGTYRVLNTETFYSYPEFAPYIDSKDYIGLSIFLFKHYLTIGFTNFLGVLEVVPTSLNYQYGLSYLQPILTVLPGTQYTLDMQLKLALGQNYYGGGTIPSVMGEAFANFGFLGWFIIPFSTMLFLRLIYYQLQRKFSFFNIIFFAYLLNYFSNSLIAGIASSSVFPFIAVVVYLIYGYYMKSILTQKGSA